MPHHTGVAAVCGEWDVYHAECVRRPVKMAAAEGCTATREARMPLIHIRSLLAECMVRVDPPYLSVYLRREPESGRVLKGQSGD